MNNSAIAVRLGARIARARREAHLSQIQLATACDWLADDGTPSQSRVSNYERGRREPALEDVLTLASVLNKPLVYFYDLDNVLELPDTPNPGPEAIRKLAEQLTQDQALLLIRYLGESLPLEDLAAASSLLSAALSDSLKSPDT